MNPATVKLWLTRGELEKLEHVVLEGRGARLLGEHSPDLRTRVFLKGLPNYLTKISQIHNAVTRGALSDVQKIATDEPKKKLALAKDLSGTPLIHKAVYNDHQDIVEWLIQNYPASVQQKDRDGRTALHYCAACKNPESIWDLLIEGGCDASVCDKKGNPAAYYLEHNTEIELPEGEKMAQRKSSNSKECLDFKPSNIRIWIHNRDIGKLQQVLWEGHGSKLKCETSNNPRVRKFLEATPFIMGSIKAIHNAVVKNDLEGFKKKIAAPIPPVILCSKDMNGLNVLHKAAGLGYTEIAREIVDRYPATVAAQDFDGKTPLHYAAVTKDDGATYELLVQSGADEGKLDNKQKTPAYYKNRPTDVDLSNLVVIPEAPRVSGSTYPKNWDWRILETEETSIRGMKKTPSSSVDVDSAFGSAESSTKNGEGEPEDFGIGSREDVKDDLVEQIKKADDALEQENATEPEFVTESGNADESEDKTENEATAAEPENEAIEAEPENEAAEVESEHEAVEAGLENGAAEAELENEEEAEAQPETETTEDVEEKSSDDDVVITMAVPENTKPNANDNSMENIDDLDMTNIEHDTNKESTNLQDEEEERNEPSTGDSGVDESRNDEDQVIVGEHEELPEVELNEGSGMAVDPEVEDLLENGNMEQLASLVLNGEGRRLVGRQSTNPELQAFIENVPAYIGKIHAVHMAAREGNLRDLQSALDRRKFAIARDGSSPHGATPLHVAVIFGHTSVIRYLAGRFPETTHAVDMDGRTSLHYAATLADNGHYYNLLLHLGANPLIQDNFGQKADYYKENQSDLSHKRLLRDFGAREKLADEMLTDKVPGGDVYSARRDVNEPETLATLERCFRLLANTRRGSVPNTPTASSGTLLGRFLKRPVFDRLKHRVTRMDHNLFDVIWPALKKYSSSNNTITSRLGSGGSTKSSNTMDDEFTSTIVAPDYESYVVFAELFDPFIRDLHCVTTTGELPEHPLPCFFFDAIETLDENENTKSAITAIQSYDLDPSCKYILAGVVDCCRNLQDFSLPVTLTINQLEETERQITEELMDPNIASVMAEGSSEDEAGTYYTLNEVLDRPSEIRARLAAAGLLLPITETEVSDERRLHGKHWPYGRGVYVAAAGDLAVWVNLQDHLRIICSTNELKPGQIGRAYIRMARVMSNLDEKLEFKRDEKLGFLSARPSAIGNTMRFNLIVKLPGLSREPENLRHLCVVRGLRVKDTMRSDTVKIGNQQCLSITELQTLQDFSRAVLNILSLEKELMLTNSMKIASLIANVFRKRASLSRGSQA